MATSLHMTESNAPSAAAQIEAAHFDLHGDARILDADKLLAGEHEVFIRNGNDLYRLRRTRHGKLILNK